MAINRGVVPADPTTPVGSLRYLLGDFDYEGLDEPEEGYGNYYNFGDAELQGFITAGGGSVTRASGHAYMRLAAVAAASAISWRSDDLSVDSKIVPSEYRLLARIAFEQADAEDDALGASGFALDHPYSNDFCVEPVQELAARPCRCNGRCTGWCY